MKRFIVLLAVAAAAIVVTGAQAAPKTCHGHNPACATAAAASATITVTADSTTITATGLAANAMVNINVVYRSATGRQLDTVNGFDTIDVNGDLDFSLAFGSSEIPGYAAAHVTISDGSTTVEADTNVVPASNAVDGVIIDAS